MPYMRSLDVSGPSSDLDRIQALPLPVLHVAICERHGRPIGVLKRWPIPPCSIPVSHRIWSDGDPAFVDEDHPLCRSADLAQPFEPQPHPILLPGHGAAIDEVTCTFCRPTVHSDADRVSQQFLPQTQGTAVDFQLVDIRPEGTLLDLELLPCSRLMRGVVYASPATRASAHPGRLVLVGQGSPVLAATSVAVDDLAIVLVGVYRSGKLELSQMTETDHAPARFTDSMQGGQHHRHQDSDDRNHDKEFNQSEALLPSHSTLE